MMTQQVSAPTTWERTGREKKPQQQTFDDNAIIDAYLAGHKEGYDSGLSSRERAFSKLLKENATKAASYTRDILAFLSKNNFAAVDAYLKLSSWDELNVMVLVQHESFLKPAFKEVYDLVYDIEDACEQEDLLLTFSFAPYSPEFNIGCLNADGFSLKYVTESETSLKGKRGKK